MSEIPVSKRRWMPILLAVSLAVNLLVVGIILGTALRIKGGEQARVPPGFGLALYHALPKEDRKVLRGELATLRSKGSERRSKDFQELRKALLQVPFEPEIVQGLLDQQVQATADLQESLHQEWLTQVSEMTDSERQIYAERLEEVIKRGRHRNGKPKKN
ncbi:periplasmic heavy metal sensor [Ruegeria arenilitoris]|uniref:periplasmic heavy metal sensor n=1 Tax=Ruegeria arenilitoris TaxID=1173585 RepID=UPI001479DE57|nr:periplasmic heavy metal sensor [Ruegeria arenilitoris]